MTVNAIEKAVKAYAADPSQDNYAKVIRELFWGIVNRNKIYYIVDKDHIGEHVPTIIRDAEGKMFSCIFSHRAKMLEEQGGDIVEEDLDTFVRHILMKFDIMGLMLDIDSGTSLIIMTDYLVTILQSVKNYRDSLGI